jgi:hypothetical protein
VATPVAVFNYAEHRVMASGSRGKKLIFYAYRLNSPPEAAIQI